MMTSLTDRVLAPALIVAAFTALAWFAGGPAMAIALGATVTVLLLVQTQPALDDERRYSHIGTTGLFTCRPARSSSRSLSRERGHD